MYRPRTQQPPPSNYRLPKQSAIPAAEDLEVALKESVKRPKCLVELPWVPREGHAFLVTVLSTPGRDPDWALFIGVDDRGEALWRHSTRDTVLIHNLIFQSAPDEHVSLVSSGSLGEKSMLAESSQDGYEGSNANASLQGRIENMQMTTLVQSVQMSQMSGRLHLFDRGNNAHIFFVEGIPVHASTAEVTGDMAIIELLGWEQGDFRFFPGESTAERSVKSRLETAILEGIALLDQIKFLESQGLKPGSYVLRKNTQISREQFKESLSTGVPADMQKQMSLYEQVDNRSRFKDILARCHLHKVEWVPIMFNLLSCSLVELAEVSPLAGKAAKLEVAEIDRSVIQGVTRSLIRAETGMFTYPAFLFMLEQEFAKSVVLGLPLSLILFEVRISTGTMDQPLPIQALKEVAGRIGKLKQSFDILGHYETFDIALLLPGSPLKVSRVIANTVASVLMNTPLIQGSSARLLLSGGVAVSPDDTQELGRLISAAREAKNKAKESGTSIKLFAEL